MSDQIVIVGAGVFGLSTAIHLALRGYTNVKVFDTQPYEETKYDYSAGCDSASSDMNKIIRSAYGTQTEYQDLSTEAIEGWKAWNAELERGDCIPPGMSKADKVFINNGNLSLTDKNELPDFELATIRNMEAAGHANTQLVTTDSRHIKIASQKGFGHALDPFQRRGRGKGYLGVLDTTGGVAVADKACRFALHKAKSLGVQFELGPENGTLDSSNPFCYNDAGRTIGIRTELGRTHLASKIIIACGGWTPSLLTELDGLCETTAGSVAMLKIPSDSPLFERFSPQNFPSWTYKVRDGAEGGLYGFPCDERGYMKIGYRGTKYTNPKDQLDCTVRSVPIIRHRSKEDQEEGPTNDQDRHRIPSQALKVIKNFLAEFLRELAENGIDIELTRLCWYTDSFDNHYVVDYLPRRIGTLAEREEDVPLQDTVLVATGGSGHAFKYLPIIGKWVVDIMEGVGLDRPLAQAWRWRTLQPGQTPVNVLMEGEAGPRALGNVEISTASDLKLGSQPRL